MLPLLHALSDCDTTSFLFGKGKRAFMNAVAEMNVATDMASVCKALEASEIISEDVIPRTVDLATVVVTSMYCGETFANLDALRYYLYARRKSLENLPSTDDALRQHVLRCIKHEPGYKQSNLFPPYWNHFILVGRTMPVEQLLC